MKLYILDVSGFLFRAYFALPPMTSSSGEATHALYGFIRSVTKLLKQEGPHHLIAVYDGPDNKRSRKQIYENYKANRIQEYEDLPEQIERSKEFCKLNGIHFIEKEGVEADDVIGTLASFADQQGIDVRIFTSDKDLCQLVNETIYLINPWKEGEILDPAAVEAKFGVTPKQIPDYLGLVGDSSDNIPGLSGFGPKTVAPLLQQYGTLENLIAHADEVPGKKKQETLKTEASLAYLSKQLATLDCQLDISFDPNSYILQTPDNKNLRKFYLELGFHSFVKELDELLGTQEEINNYLLVDTEAELEHLIALLRQTDEVAFDTETTELNPILAKPIGIGFCITQQQAYYVPFNGKLGIKALDKLRPLLQESSLFGHHTKYDCHVLQNMGVSPKHISFDTILAAYLLNPSSRTLSLDTLALERFGKVKTSIKSLIGTGKKQISMALVPIEKVSAYCCEDVDYTFRLKNQLEQELKERGLDKLLYNLELPLSSVLRKMERIGVYVDCKQLKELTHHVGQQLQEVEQQIYTLAGATFNLNSPKQLAEVLFEKLGIKPLKKTATGFSTDATVLETLAINHPIAALILHYRTLEKLRSTYLETLPEQVNPHTGRIHPTFNQVIAATGRLACQDPNLQNIPIRSELGRQIRKAFCPQQSGWSYLSADYSQIELRLLAHFSEDPSLIHAFLNGEDIHRYTASLMFGKQQVSEEERHQAKAINFGIIYGQQAYGLSRQLGIDIRKAAEFIEAYYKRYPKVFEYLQNSIIQARKTGKAITMTGRERIITDIDSTNAILKAAAERLAVNTPLQGTAADLIKKAMLSIDQQLQTNQLKSMMILQVHDELIFECPDFELDQVKILVKNAMEGVFSLRVPLIVDVHVGKNWEQC